LTVEAWVFWEGSDWQEIQAATGTDVDFMTLFCGQRAYGFQYRSRDEPPAPDGWTFFLYTETQAVQDTGLIPLPLNEWAHLAATYDGAMIRVFLNGIQQAEVAASGNIPVVGEFGFRCASAAPWTEIFNVGLKSGFNGGMRQLRIWNRALSEAEIVANAGLHLDGTESGLVGYWPLDGPLDPIQAPNKVAGGPPLLFSNYPKPEWRLTDPLFVVREDLVEDAVVTDCPWLGLETWAWVDAQDDGDQDLIFSGGSADFGRSFPAPFWALIRESASGFVFDTASAISGTPLAETSFRVETADFNGDGRLDVFTANMGCDGCEPFGAPDTLLLSRPDGRLEDASGNLLAPPCDAVTPQFEGQHLCNAGEGHWGRTPGIRYPGTGEAVAPDRGHTHGVAAGDTDGDGDVDILVGNRTVGIEAPYLLVNDGNGGFLADWQLLPDMLYKSNLNGEDPTSPQAFLLNDLDGDGHVDLVTSPEPSGSGEYFTGIHWNDGSGDFSSADTRVILPIAGIPNQPCCLPTSATTPMATDIDNDGDKDLLIVWNPEDLNRIFRSSLQILINHGGRVFVDETVARVGTPPQAGMPRSWVSKIYTGDVNQDGCPDLLFLEDELRLFEVGIWLNNCQGYFSPMAGPGLPKRGSTFIPLDFDGDGDIDLISSIQLPTGIAGTASCIVDPTVGDGIDYIDFAVLLNVNPTKFKSELITKNGFED
jgi:hypothetical protein